MFVGTRRRTVGWLVPAVLAWAGCAGGGGGGTGNNNNSARVCGNQICEAGETALMCPEDCGCGNYIVNDGEDCDGANLGGQTCLGLGYEGGTLMCTPQCTFNTIMCVGNVCGNGLIEVNEYCDASDLNGQSCSSLGFDGGVLACSSVCRFDVSGCTGSGCGDGVKDADEECDGDDLGGADCNDVGYASGTLACAYDCTFDISGCGVPLLCGNGAIDAGEDCDTGGQETTACDLDCTFAECGDGLRNQTAGEACDDGGESAGCDPDCTLPECGDDYLNASAGEECDATDFGTATCQTEGFYAGTLECTTQCAIDNSGCHNCGNGTVDAGEQCDDGGESAGCDADCTQVVCGDGTLNQTAGEECDDGNNTDGDGCDAGCHSECAPASLTTHFNGGNGFDGNMFDVVALTDIWVHSFDVNIDAGTGVPVEIWFRTGTFVGHESSQTGWTMIGSTTVNSTGSLQPTALNLSLNQPVSAGQTVAFYVTVNDPTVGMKYTDGTSVGSVAAQNSDLQILEGNGGGYFSVTFSPRVWNGTIYYDACP